MPGRPIEPPLGYPVQELRTPNCRDGFFPILVERECDFFQENTPVKRGTPYANLKGADSRVIAEFASNPLYLLKQLRPGASSSSDFGNSHDYVIWVFATVPLAQDTYNSAIDYDGEVVACPIFTRVTLVKRNAYEASPTLTVLTTLTGLLSVAITGAGANYTYATATIATGATAEAVCLNGQIIDWIVTAEGSSVASGGAMVITGDGTGATATARIQPAGAKLVSQKKRELADDDPRSHDYVQVVRVYSTLPGATITNSIYDSESDIWISTSKTKKPLADITESISHSTDQFVTIVSSEAIDANVGYEVVTVIPKSPHHDEATAIIEYEMQPYQFPAFLITWGDYMGSTYFAVDFYGPGVGYRQTTSLTVLHTKKTWFTIAATTPAFVYDDITPTDIVLNDHQYSNVLINDTTRLYNGYTVTIPETTPTFTEYYGTVTAMSSLAPPADPFAPGTPPKWIGTDRVIKGGVVRAGSEYRFKTVSISVEMR